MNLHQQSLLALVALAYLTTAPALAQSHATTYHLVYGGKDLGEWTSMKQDRSPIGTYDGTNFDPTNGSGFARLQFIRKMTAPDRASLWSSLPSGNNALVVTAMQGTKAVGVTSCKQAERDEFDASGDVGTADETLTFACAGVTSGATPPPAD